jgi:hypothetical protein
LRWLLKSSGRRTISEVTSGALMVSCGIGGAVKFGRKYAFHENGCPRTRWLVGIGVDPQYLLLEQVWKKAGFLRWSWSVMSHSISSNPRTAGSCLASISAQECAFCVQRVASSLLFCPFNTPGKFEEDLDRRIKSRRVMPPYLSQRLRSVNADPEKNPLCATLPHRVS